MPLKSGVLHQGVILAVQLLPGNVFNIEAQRQVLRNSEWYGGARRNITAHSGSGDCETRIQGELEKKEAENRKDQRFEDGMVEQEETSQRTLEVEIVRHAYRRSWKRKKRKNRLRTIGSKRPRTSTLNRSSTKSTKVEDSDLVCTHPMFGPESGKDGSKDLNFMYERVRVRDEDLCSSFPRIFEHKGSNKESAGIIANRGCNKDRMMSYICNRDIVLDTMTKVGVALPIQMSSLEPSQIPSNFIWLFTLKLSGSQWQSKDGWVTWILLDMDSLLQVLSKSYPSEFTSHVH
ncbi:NAD(P)-binding domain-containing protein [Artemisia annua]|uniref:NAD(P)-binding domain-containing protein n=1 Tax=Artemisia annua TaxID=35608 RepID=A0A2U1P4E1_ARTAN|nr:NAD(P)-binding domain-containing protein [Artemisia annua]